jgi:hypothetical protein
MTLYRIAKIDSTTPPDAVNSDDVVVWITDMDNPATLIRKVRPKPPLGAEALWLQDTFCDPDALDPNDYGYTCP